MSGSVERADDAARGYSAGVDLGETGAVASFALEVAVTRGCDKDNTLFILKDKPGFDCFCG